MTNPPAGSPGNGRAVLDHDRMEDDESEVTQPDRRAPKATSEVLIEKTIKFRFQHNNTHDTADPALIHILWMQTVQEALGPDIQIFNNNGGLVKKVNVLHWTIEKHKKEFKLHTQNEYPTYTGKKKVTPSSFIIHRIRTNATLTSIKRIEEVNDLLRRENTYISEHHWCEDVWDLTRLGFVIGINPEVYDPKQAHEKLMQEIAAKLPQYAKIPKFALVYSTPGVTWNNQVIRTKAYAIETEKKYAISMMKTLTTAYKETKEYVPFQQRTKHPEAYAKHIARHTKILSDNRTIVLNYFGRDVMFYLQDHIMQIVGVQAVVPANTVDLDGKYRISVHKDHFYSTRKYLSRNLDQWCSEYVQCDKEKTMKFPGKPEVAPITSDGYSSGEGSYMTDSVNTAMSYSSVLSDLTTQDPSVEKHWSSQSLPSAPATWASKIRESLQNNRSGSHSVTETTVPTTVVNDELISDLASSKEEVEELKLTVSNMLKEKEIDKVESERQRKELQKEVDRQKEAMALQAEEQRIAMDRRLEEQRKAFETRAAQERAQLESSIASQVAAALAAEREQRQRRPQQQAMELTAILENYERRMERQMQLMISMFQGQSEVQGNVGVRTPPRPAAAKRPAEIEESSHHQPTPEEQPFTQHPPISSRPTDPEQHKRRDIRASPAKTGHSTHQKPAEYAIVGFASSPTSDISASQTMTPQLKVSKNTEIPTSPFCHDPPSSKYGMEVGEEASLTYYPEDTPTAPPFRAFEYPAGVLDEDAIDPIQLEEIYAMHATHEVQDLSMIEGDTHEEMSLSSHKSIQDTSDDPQAQPEEDESLNFCHV